MVSKIINDMIEYDKGDIKRINHFLKVYAFAKTIAEAEGVDRQTQLIIELAAAMHDVGIHISEQKYGSSAGRYQELEGPPIADKMLKNRNCDVNTAARVCYLIAHHHTYSSIDGIDYQILVEADFLVNFFEDEFSPDAVKSVLNKHFKTKSGINILKNMFLS